MKTIYLVCFSIVSTAVGEIPKTPRYEDFNEILTKDVFKKLPQKEVQQVKKVEPPKPKEEYFLKGMTKLSDGWWIQLANKKTPAETIDLYESKGVKDGLKFVSLQRGKLDYLDTKVTIVANGVNQTISYDKKQQEAVRNKQVARQPVKQSQAKPNQLTPEELINQANQKKNQDNQASQQAGGNAEKETPLRRRIIRIKPKDQSGGNQGSGQE